MREIPTFNRDDHYGFNVVCRCTTKWYLEDDLKASIIPDWTKETVHSIRKYFRCQNCPKCKRRFEVYPLWKPVKNTPSFYGPSYIDTFLQSTNKNTN